MNRTFSSTLNPETKAAVQKYQAILDGVCQKISNLTLELTRYEDQRQELEEFIEKIIEMENKFTPIQEPRKDDLFTFSSPPPPPKTKMESLITVERPTNGDSAPRVTWTATILLFVTERNRGVDYDELKEHIKLTELAPKLERSPQSFYGAIEKLVNNQRVKKYGARLYSLKAFEQFKKDVEAGIIDDDSAKRAARGGGKPSVLGEAIKEFLEQNSDGASHGTIKKAMLNSGGSFVDSLNKHHSYLYNCLALLIKKGEVIRNENGGYSIVK